MLYKQYLYQVPKHFYHSKRKRCIFTNSYDTQVFKSYANLTADKNIVAFESFTLLLHKTFFHCVSVFRFGSCEALTFLDYLILRSTFDGDVLSKLFHMHKAP